MTFVSSSYYYNTTILLLLKERFLYRCCLLASGEVLIKVKMTMMMSTNAMRK